MKSPKNVKYTTGFKINTGSIIFIFIFIYMVLRIGISLQHKSLSIYEVQNSYIDTNISTNALIVREEKLIDTNKSGYISYYIRDGEKVGKNKTIYSVDETKEVYDKLNSSDADELALSDENLKDIRSKIASFESSFNYSTFSDVYSFKYDVQNAVLELTNEAIIDELTSLDGEASKSSTFTKVYTEEAGIVTYYQDGFENFNIKSFKASDVDKTAYSTNHCKKTLKTGELVNVGDPVYKLVTSEKWNLIAPLSNDDAQRLKDKETVLLKIHDSSKDIRCRFELRKVDNEYFAIISLNQQMVNYIDNRYIDIVIKMDQNNGLKIPNSSIVKKKTYRVPLSYLCYGSGKSQEKKFLNVKKLDAEGEITLKQMTPTIYKKDDKYMYIDPNDFVGDEVITDGEGKKSMSISDAKEKKLKGVYCVNQGITTFRYIDVLFDDDEYTIVAADVDYSIAWYDRIVLDSSMAKENQIIK